MKIIHMRKILFNKNRSKESVNNTNIIPVEINRDASIFHDEVMVDTLNMMDLYNNEKDKSTKHRFIFTMYPICTNVLYNKISEVIYKEGSDDTVLLRHDNKSGYNTVLKKLKDLKPSPVANDVNFTATHVIRNTEYSNPHFEMTYHCGANIFNNHLLRNKENVSVQRQGIKNKTVVYDEKGNKKDEISNSFNTIGDLARNDNSEILQTNLPSYGTHNVYVSSKYNKAIPLYLYDTIKTFKESYNDNLKRKNGWIGFTNPTTLHISVKYNEKYYINKCLNNEEGCAFIDMAPERDLFNFIPKKNQYRNRLEYNWDYFLTYPAKSEYNDGQILIGKGKGLPLCEKYETYISQNNVSVTTFCSPIKHNLEINDFVRIVFESGNVVCQVVSNGTMKGDDKSYYFTVYTSDIEFYLKNGDTPRRFLKVVNGYDCEYYFRKFKKLGMYKSSINQLAFAKTIYDDNISQIIFTDEVDIADIKDNRERPLTEVYLTILKANRGNKEWYDENIFDSDKIEYSHVFGTVTSGLDIPDFCRTEKLPIIRSQHCIDNDVIENIKKIDSELKIPLSSTYIEEDINKDMNEFYGDLVEFNVVTLDETVLEDVLHRFNTKQRETKNTAYSTLYYDEIYNDIYDYANIEENDDKIVKAESATTNIIEYKLNEGYANISPEGYVYKPHHKIVIGRFSNTIEQLYDVKIAVENKFYDPQLRMVSFQTKENYNLMLNDIICVVDKTTFENNLFSVKTTEFDEEKQIYTYNCLAENNKRPIITNDYYIFKHNLAIPEGAYMVHNDTGQHLWREIELPSNYDNREDLYKIPFTNNAFYHHENIVFPVRRQDPLHTYGMYVEKNGKQIENNFEIPSTKFDKTPVEYVPEEIGLTCF